MKPLYVKLYLGPELLKTVNGLKVITTITFERVGGTVLPIKTPTKPPRFIGKVYKCEVGVENGKMFKISIYLISSLLIGNFIGYVGLSLSFVLLCIFGISPNDYFTEFLNPLWGTECGYFGYYGGFCLGVLFMDSIKAD
jgi:hypothetical protein